MSKRVPKQVAQALNWDWKKSDTLIYGNTKFTPSKLILGFDMDDTLIKTKSGAKFAKDATDWKWWHDSIIPVVQDYAKKGYQIVIFTNQNGIAKGHTNEMDVKKKIEELQRLLDVPLAALIASSDDIYRKPRMEMWRFFQENLNNNTKVELKDSIYCGDAAGRVQGKKKDFSDSDLKFAINIGLTFKTPEQLFLKQSLNEDYSTMIEFNPKNIPKDGSLFKDSTQKVFVKPKEPEMIIMVGSAGSGKSTFVVTHLKDYVRVNRDTLKTKEKCLKVAEEAINQKKHVVIDNTNPTAADRELFIKLAKTHSYPVRAFYMEVKKDLAFHNDTMREANKFRKHLSERVGQIPIHTFFKNFQIPTVGEGLSEIKILNFIAGPFDNKDDEETYFSFVKGK